MVSYLVGVDGSDYSLAALAWAREMAAAGDAIVVVHAWEMPLASGYETAGMLDPQPIEHAAHEFMDETLAAIDDPRVTGRVMSGPAARAIVDVANELAEGSDDDSRGRDGTGAGGAGTTGEPTDVVVVVGHRGSGKLSLWFGSTANFVTHHTRHPVIVVRGDERIPTRRVAVGIDARGDAEPDGPSMAALRWALALPGVEQIDVHHAVFVPGFVAGRLSSAPVESDEVHEATVELLNQAIEAAGGAPAGVGVDPVASHGSAAFALIEASREVDLVVVGSRGHGGFHDLLLGSTTLEVTAYAHCPVAVVR